MFCLHEKFYLLTSNYILCLRSNCWNFLFKILDFFSSLTFRLLQMEKKSTFLKNVFLFFSYALETFWKSLNMTNLIRNRPIWRNKSLGSQKIYIYNFIHINLKSVSMALNRKSDSLTLDEHVFCSQCVYVGTMVVVVMVVYG